MEENKDIVIPQAFSDDLFNPKITGKQRKFILLLVHSEGLKTGRQCAIEAGYAPGSAVVRAAELQNPEKFQIRMEECDNIVNQVLTVVGFAHICLQVRILFNFKINR